MHLRTEPVTHTHTVSLQRRYDLEVMQCRVVRLIIVTSVTHYRVHNRLPLFSAEKVLLTLLFYLLKVDHANVSYYILG